MSTISTVSVGRGAARTGRWRLGGLDRLSRAGRLLGPVLLMLGLLGLLGLAGATPSGALAVAAPLGGVAQAATGGAPEPAPPAPGAPASGQTVFVVQMRDEIDLGLPPYLARILDQARREGAAAVILEIDTPGGRLDAVLQLRDLLLNAPVRTIAFVNRHAFSAGALVALASQEVYLAPGAVLGAAT
ncbi:MAG TPA: hypothetical protein VHS99_16920, partial [Chloroflexota bacterium]|nr:hypothetical protein [Chloroflexota bacterium]